MHIELVEMLRCPEPHPQEHLVLSTGEMLGRMVRSGIVGCPECRNEYPIRDGVVDFTGCGMRDAGCGGPESGTHPASRIPNPASRIPHPEYSQTLQALLDLSGPGGIVVLLGQAARHAGGLAGLMGGIHFVGINAPGDVEELPVLSLLEAEGLVPLRDSMARGVVVGADVARTPWLGEARRVVLRGRRLVIENDRVAPEGVTRLASAEGLWVGEKA